MIAPPMMRPPMPRAGLAPAPQAAMRPPAAMPGVPRPMRDSGGDVPPVQSPKAPRPPKTPLTGKVHAGPINSTVAGRTDHLPVHVPEGAYVIPADVVGHLGESNNAAGFKVLRRMFSGLPRDASETPYSGAGGPYDAGPHPYDEAAPLPYDSKMASGGKAGTDSIPTATISPGKTPGNLISRTPAGRTVAKESPHAITVSDARLVNQKLKGKGHGVAMYKALADHAIANGKPLLSSSSVSDDAANIYSALSRRGYKVTPHPDLYSHVVSTFGGEVWTPNGEPAYRVDGMSKNGSEPIGGFDAVRPWVRPVTKATGGSTGTVPIIAAGGEHVLTPDEVRMAGAGDLDRGHRVLDKFVLRVRKDLIKTLRGLDPPKRD